jgi:hypothetical protein
MEVRLKVIMGNLLLISLRWEAGMLLAVVLSVGYHGASSGFASTPPMGFNTWVRYVPASLLPAHS